MLNRAALKRRHRGDNDIPRSSTKNVQRDVVHETALDDPTVNQTAEKRLEDSVFGGEEDFVENITKPKQTPEVRKRPKVDNAPVWEDDEDEDTALPPDKMSYNPQWAKLDWEKSDGSGNESDSETKNLLQRTGDYLRSSEALPKNIIQMKKCTDANKERPSSGKIKSVEFHPSAQVVLAAGMDNSLNLFQVDGKNNLKIQSVFLRNFPIYSAHFTCDGSQVVLSSRHRSFMYYDMIAGQVVEVPKIKGMEENNMKRMIMSPDGKYIVFLGDYGAIHFLSAQSKEWIDTIKMNGSVESAAFNSDGSKLLSVGDDGETYIWDVNRRSAIHRFKDDGCIKGTAIAVSRNNQYVAVGSNSGVVNIYDESCFQSANPKPVKAVMNLRTECTDLKFNATTEILAMASNYTEQAVKLLHVPSLSVFKNFPDRSEGLSIPFCMDFSANSGYFCIGDHRGHATLFRVKHYSSY